MGHQNGFLITWIDLVSSSVIESVQRNYSVCIQAGGLLQFSDENCRIFQIETFQQLKVSTQLLITEIDVNCHFTTKKHFIGEYNAKYSDRAPKKGSGIQTIKCFFLKNQLYDHPTKFGNQSVFKEQLVSHAAVKSAFRPPKIRFSQQEKKKEQKVKS